jgi:hypothetical protein
MGVVRFRTETGSVYTVDNEALLWRRLVRSPRSGVLRTESGRLTAPATPVLGEMTLLVGPPFAPGLGPRLVITTRVTAILPMELPAPLEAA